MSNWDIARDIALIVIGVLVCTVPLLREIKKPKKSIRYIAFMLNCSLLIVWFGIDKILSDRINDAANKADNDSLHLEILGLKKSGSLDSVRDVHFQKKLLSDFGIGRDSITNLPYRIIPKTEINLNTGIQYGPQGGSNNTTTYNFKPQPRVLTKILFRTLLDKMPDKTFMVDLAVLEQTDESYALADKVKNALKREGYNVIDIVGWSVGMSVPAGQQFLVTTRGESRYKLFIAPNL